MHATADPAPLPPSSRHRRRLIAAGVAVSLAGAGLGAGLVTAFTGSPSAGSGPAPPSASYAYFEQVIGRYGAMMGGDYGWMTGPSGYRWMMGGASAPGWVAGGDLPGFMTGAGDPAKVMGSLFADAPGPRVGAAEADHLGAAVPAGATVDRAADTVTFATTAVALTVLASPSMPAENFRIADLTDPTISVPAGARVTIELINADADMAHGLVVTGAGVASAMPMMSSAPAFAGAAQWFLGESTAAGMHAATFTFSAATPGRYRYLCPLPGHAQEGMAGAFTVR